MDYISKKNKIKTFGLIGTLVSLGCAAISLLVAFIYVTSAYPGYYGLLIALATVFFVIAVFIFVFSFQVRAREYTISKHKVQIYAGTRKTILAVDDKIINEVRVFASIKKSLFSFFFKRKKLKLNTIINKKDLVVEVGAFNSLNVKYNGEKISPTKK